MRRALALLALPAIALVTATLSACSGPTHSSPKAQAPQPQPQAQRSPTLPPLTVITTLSDAVALFDVKGGDLMLSPIVMPQSVSYVQTTIGQANKLLQPYLDWTAGTLAVEGGLTADTPAWVFVAYGEWERGSQGRIVVPTPNTAIAATPATVLWEVVAQGKWGHFEGASDVTIDVSQLGTPAQLPFPTRPALGS